MLNQKVEVNKSWLAVLDASAGSTVDTFIVSLLNFFLRVKGI